MQLVWNLKDTTRPRTCVRIDRANKVFGNPFVIGQHGNREEVIVKYRAWLWNRVQNEDRFMIKLAELAGRPLACHCAPLPCHGDVLAAAAVWARETLYPHNYDFTG